MPTRFGIDDAHLHDPFHAPALTHSTTDRPGSRGRNTMSGWKTK